LNFFASSDSAESYLREHDDISGQVISMPEAIEAGRCIFGEVLTQN
jgi:hypothetical protein